MANYLDFSADVFGVGSDVDALAKQVNENAAGRCTYFDDSSDRISTDFANHSVKRAAKFRELKKGRPATRKAERETKGTEAGTRSVGCGATDNAR